MKTAFIINWKTTAAGILIAGDAVIRGIATALSNNATIPWRVLAVQFIVGIALVLAKDFNTTP